MAEKLGKSIGQRRRILTIVFFPLSPSLCPSVSYFTSTFGASRRYCSTSGRCFGASVISGSASGGRFGRATR